MRRVLVLLLLILLALPVLMVGCLRSQPPLVSSFMLQSEVKPVDYQWVPTEEIADVARKAVVASEDQKFWKHAGFDVEAMQQAHRENQTRSRKRGASTISQQTAKNLFLWPGGGYLRKAVEAYFTMLMEWLWTKERILEVYLNIIELGPGIYGVEAGAQHFFKKSARELTAPEAARLAAVLPNPKRLHAGNPSPYVQARAAWILRQMGYAPRPTNTPDPEPIDPDEPEPQISEADAAETETSPVHGEDEEEDSVDMQQDGVTTDATSEDSEPADGTHGDAGMTETPSDEERGPHGGGRVIEESLDEEESPHIEQSLIL